MAVKRLDCPNEYCGLVPCCRCLLLLLFLTALIVFVSDFHEEANEAAVKVQAFSKQKWPKLHSAAT